jgi:hypothetical protein
MRQELASPAFTAFALADTLLRPFKTLLSTSFRGPAIFPVGNSAPLPAVGALLSPLLWRLLSAAEARPGVKSFFLPPFPVIP